jgi:hypothetical protein
MACDHSGYHSGRARYLRESSELQLMLVCDDCGIELVLLERIDYSPPPELQRATPTPPRRPRVLGVRLSRSRVMWVRRASLLESGGRHGAVRLGVQRSLARAARTLGG